MKDFTDLESLHRHLEEKAIEYRDSQEIAVLFQKVRDLKEKKNEADEAEMAQWEIDFFNFSIENGEIKSMSTWPNEKGEVIEYPSLNRFDDRTYEYLIGRANSTENPVLKARYSHILWCSERKHAKYARLAVESYLNLIEIYEEKDREAPQEHFGHEVIQAMRNAYFIGYQTKYEVEKIKSELKRLIREFNFGSSFSFGLRSILMN